MTRRSKALVIVVVLLFVAGIAIAYLGYTGRYRDDYQLHIDAKNLKSTVVTPTLEEPIAPGKNVLWCSTFQLAWNEGCSLLGEDIRFDNEPAMVPLLNRKAATKADVDAASYVAMAGWTPGIIKDLDAAIRSRFGPGFGFQPWPMPPPDDWFIAYACLAKDLKFATPFEPIREKTLFAGKPVRCFGMEHGSRAQGEQVIILHDELNGGPFIVELRTTSPDDRLILAKVKPAATLGGTVEQVHALILKAAADRRARWSGDHEDRGDDHTTLVVPKLSFDLIKNYGEIEGKHLNVAHKRANGMPVIIAGQEIIFQLNEHGVRLRSEARMATKAAISSPLIFDGPFLVLLERRGAKAPYFAIWVDNAELLVPAD